VKKARSSGLKEDINGGSWRYQPEKQRRKNSSSGAGKPLGPQSKCSRLLFFYINIFFI